jgi:hypothetical protein
MLRERSQPGGPPSAGSGDAGVGPLDAGGSLIARRGSRSAIMAARQANEVMLPFYVLQKPVVVAAAWAIVRWRRSLGNFTSPGCCSA